ncbi:YlxM family DNA-binding protein [Ruminococcus sp.]|uniref:YlxM family DNA-binding protein n=1 Tax=Ruminococcus sp. TaxID=41978 RepID=UPI002E821FC2|nr:sigma factor-like helix-turn-helix DNA-binding protein [Ruminococcus sp.]MEE3493182.1 sigma factor-like helix-turn-helix DNA-binding protein [Ruminococcus sp.]
MLYRKDEAPIMNSKPDISLLYDFYAELLNDSQRRVVELYVNEDLSLSEVAEILHISRQGVRDSLGRAERKLRDYEQKLGLLRDYHQRLERDDAIRGLIDKIKHTESGDITPLLDQIEAFLQLNSD